MKTSVSKTSASSETQAFHARHHMLRARHMRRNTSATRSSQRASRTVAGSGGPLSAPAAATSLRSNSVSLSTYSSFAARLRNPGAYTSQFCEMMYAHT